MFKEKIIQRNCKKQRAFRRYHPRSTSMLNIYQEIFRNVIFKFPSSFLLALHFPLAFKIFSFFVDEASSYDSEI